MPSGNRTTPRFWLTNGGPLMANQATSARQKALIWATSSQMQISNKIISLFRRAALISNIARTDDMGMGMGKASTVPKNYVAHYRAER